MSIHTIGVPQLNKGNQRKSNSLTFTNGYQAVRPAVPIGGGEKITGVSELNDRDVKALAIQTKTMYETTSSGTNRIVTRDKEPPTFVPAFVAYDKQVLRFGAFFKESVVESRAENFRIRLCEIVYFLEDDSIGVNEKAQENSGIPQGQFIRRHKIPNPARPGDFVNIFDLNVGREITLYGRTFFIYNADDFTRNYYEQQGYPIPPNQPQPIDPYLQNRKDMINAKGAPKEPKPAMDAYAQFLKFDGEILHFYALWDDTDSLYGEKRKFVLKYYLADDTVEVNEIYKANCGYDPYPKFFRRGRLLRTSRLPQPGEKPEYIKENELRVGSTVPIAGRNFFIYDCADRTRKYYQAKYGVNMEPIASGIDDSDPPVDPPIPPHTGFGSEEDSLGSVFSLNPKPPRKDLVKLTEKEGITLRFLARMDTRKPDDINRRFIITFYLMNDTVQIFEEAARNSGIVSGKFLERRKVKNPATNDYFKPTDFYVGAVVEMLSQKFILLDADDHSLKYMEENSQEYPMSNPVVVRQRLLEELSRIAAKNGKGNTSDPIRELFARFDKDRNSVLSVSEFRDMIRTLQVDLTEQEILTLMRRYDTNKDGSVDYAEFLAQLERDEAGEGDYAQAFGTQNKTRSGTGSLFGVGGALSGRGDGAGLDSRPNPQELLALAKIMDVLRDKIHNRKPHIRDTFRELDTNKDSYLSVEEFKVGLSEKIGITLNERMLEFLLEKFFYDEEENLWKPRIDYTDFIEALWEKTLNKI